MHKKTLTAIVFLALILVGGPALAGSVAAPTGSSHPGISETDGSWLRPLLNGFTELLSWLLPTPSSEQAPDFRSGAMEVQDPEEPAPTEPGLVIVPFAGPAVDPDG